MREEAERAREEANRMREEAEHRMREETERAREEANSMMFEIDATQKMDNYISLSDSSDNSESKQYAQLIKIDIFIELHVYLDYIFTIACKRFFEFLQNVD